MTIDTRVWFDVAYVWVTLVYVAYTASIAIRARRARQQLSAHERNRAR